MTQTEQWIPVQSSFIKQVSLCQQSRVFVFRTKRGDDIFVEVSNPRINLKSLYESFIKSESKGKFYNKVFRNNPLIT